MVGSGGCPNETNNLRQPVDSTGNSWLSATSDAVATVTRTRSVIEDPPRRTAIEDYLCKLLMSYPIDRKTDHLAGVGKSQLLFDVSSMGFNRFYAEIQLVGDRFGVVSFTEHH